MLSHAACSIGALVACREWVHATNVTMQRAPTIRFSATSSFGMCAWRSIPLRKISGMVLIRVLSPEESRQYPRAADRLRYVPSPTFRAVDCRADTTKRATVWYLRTARAGVNGRL